MEETPDKTRAFCCEQTVLAAWGRHLGPGMALLAVGGFGRRELFPYSDVDLLLLAASEEQATARREEISRFLQTLWDAGLRVSHSVRTVDECCTVHEGNRELNISLLDQRFLAGDEQLHARLVERWLRFLRAEGTAIARNLVRLTRARHSKYHDTIYHLEPNIKDTPGGLRDFHVIHWLTRLGAAEKEPPLEAAREFLFRLRQRLHEWSGRDNNTLTFQAQDELSEHPAEMMREYFRHARAISQAALRTMEAVEERGSGLLTQFRDWRSRLSNSDFTVSRERVYLRSPQALQADPDLQLRLFLFVARHGVRLAEDTKRRLGDKAAWTGWAFWEELLSSPGAAKALRAMQETGVLSRLVPEWSGIECLVVRDFYHRYTVDEHTLVALEALDRISDPRFRELLEEIEDIAVLRFALLLHDSGKGKGKHVTESLRIADQVMRRVDVPAQEAATVRFLIERHLELSNVMSGRDLTDPATAQALADRVETLERLKLLALLTYADISAVHPGAMNPWRLEQLWQVYLVAHQELTRELESDRIRAQAEQSPEEAEFLEGFPTRYLRTHQAAEIRRHLELAKQAVTLGTAVEVTRERGAWRLTLAASDRAFLFASAAGALASFGLNILKAEAFSNARGLVLDTFRFADPLRTLELNPSEVDRLRDTVRRVLDGRVNLEALLRARPKPAPPSRKARIQPNVSFHNEASQGSTLIEIVAEDRPGLLYDLSRILSSHGCNIEVVLIDTEAHKALDVFYVTLNGEKVSASVEDELRAELRRVCAGE